MSEKSELRLHLGCGEKYLPGYVNIDYPPSEHTVIRVKADMYHDIRTLSYPENSVAEVRSHHLLEHFSRVEALSLLLRWRRWLRPGGRLMVEAPDFAGCARAYARAWSLRRRFQLGRHVFGSQEASWAYHQDFWDKAKFRLVLREMGFKNVEVRCYRNVLAQRFPHVPFLNVVGGLLPDAFYRKRGGHKLPNIVAVAEKDAGCAVSDSDVARRLLALSLVGRELENENLLRVWLKEFEKIHPWEKVGLKPGGKKILFTVEFYAPKIGGAEEVVKQLAERLAADGNEVTVATTYLRDRKGPRENGVRIEEFRLAGNLASGIRGRKSEVQRYEELLERDFDVVLNYAAQSWPTDLALLALDKIKAKKVMVPCGYSGLYDPQYAEYLRRLPDYLRKYDALVYMSPSYRDKIFGDEHGLGDKAVLIPNGAGEEEFARPAETSARERLGIKTPRLLISVSNHYLAKGHRFIIRAFNRMRRQDATLLILGECNWPRSLKEWGHFLMDRALCRLTTWLNPGVKMADGRDRQLVLAAYKEADLFLFGSKVECAPLVMYESFAAGLPLVTTEVGNVRDHEPPVVLASSPEAMARRANELLDDDSRRRRLADKGRVIWREGHTWREITARYENLFRKLCA